MVLEPLKPKRGGFLRSFGCALFNRDFLKGEGPYGSPRISPEVGACQADIFYQYKTALMRTTALDRATRAEEKTAKRQKRRISPENIEVLSKRYLARMPYKAQICRFHSFVIYFSNIQKLGWVEFTGREEPSAFQEHYPQGQPRKYFRLTQAGINASDDDWANPQRALYGRK
jgi:hypothetical protein